MSEQGHDEATGDAIAAPGASTEPMVFEQPLNERLRTFLRLDFLYNQTLYHNEKASSWGSRSAMTSLLDMLAIATRGDLRSDVLKELDRHIGQLTDYLNHPGTDPGRVRSLVGNLTQLRTELHGGGAHWLQPLRDSEFLAAIKHRTAIPGGTCEFDLPAYYAWQQFDAARRKADLTQWTAPLTPLAEALQVLLGLLRDSGVPHKVAASAGQYQQSLTPGRSYLLLRVHIDPQLQLVPEISGHRLMVLIRLMRQDADGRLKPSGSDASFELTLCA